MHRCRTFPLACALLALAACREARPPADSAGAQGPCGSEARAVVQRLGEQMRRVSLLAPDSIAAREIADAYGPLVTPELLHAWQATPAGAPGRQVSNPWPARIDIRSMQAESGACRVEGDVVYVTTADTSAVVERRPVTVHVRQSDGRVSAFDAPAKNGNRTDANADPSAHAAPASALAPADVVRDYYAAIRAGHYDSAYVLWEGKGKASGQTRAEFASGFARTTEVRASIGDSIHIEGAAGSQYATVPVVVDAVLRGGQRQHFEGSYTLRRTLVDGASAEQRRWHIYSAQLRAR